MVHLHWLSPAASPTTNPYICVVSEESVGVNTSTQILVLDSVSVNIHYWDHLYAQNLFTLSRTWNCFLILEANLQRNPSYYEEIKNSINRSQIDKIIFIFKNWRKVRGIKKNM